MKQLSRSIPLSVRFALRVTRQASGCWLWTGSKSGKGYGKMYMNGRSEMAHRVSWTIHHGPILDGLFVLHKCDTPSCVNPEHLFLGTQSDNILDAVSKGRVRLPWLEKVSA